MQTKSFHIGDVLSVTTGRLLSPDGIDGVYRILNFLLSDNLFTHQLPRAGRDASPFIIEQHPWLANVDASGVDTKNWKQFLEQQIHQHGKTMKLHPIPHAKGLHREPMGELEEIVGQDQIITIEGE